MNAELDALFQRILDDPADDLARLIYADHLEEAGDIEQAAFIRHGIQHPDQAFTCDGDGSVGINCPEFMEKEFPPPYGYTELVESTRTVLCPVCHGQLVQGVPIAFLGEGRWRGHRGFLDQVWCTLLTWRTWGPRLMLTAPVREARMLDHGPGWLTRDPLIRRRNLTHVEFTQRRCWRRRSVYAGTWPASQNYGCYLPDWIFNEMAGGAATDCYVLASEQLAWKALSDAAIRWAEREVTS